VLTSCTKENTPPSASITVEPLYGDSLTVFTFDANNCQDSEDSKLALMIRWDWDADGIWDTDYSTYKKANHRFKETGTHIIIMEVIDRNQLSDIDTIAVNIIGEIQLSTMTDQRDGIVYKTVKIFDKWWMAENLKIGNLIISSREQIDNGIIEKYAYNDNSQNIDKYGGIYFWNEAMKYNNIEGSQGICPSGWHVPSRNEWATIGMEAPQVYLKEYYGVGGKSGLNLQKSGYFVEDQPYFGTGFLQYGEIGFYWTSTNVDKTIFTTEGVLYLNQSFLVAFGRANNIYSGFWYLPSGDLRRSDDFSKAVNVNIGAYIRCVMD